MTAEERRELIMRPFPVVTRLTTTARWGGTATYDTFFSDRLMQQERPRAERGGRSDAGSVAGPSAQPLFRSVDLGGENKRDDDNELQILRSDDLSSEEAAEALGCSTRTVRRKREALRRG